MIPSLSLLTLSLVGFVAATPLSTNYQDAPRRRSGFALAPLVADYHPHGSVNNSYIVMFKDDVHPAAFENHFNFLQQAHESSPLDREDGGLMHVWDAHVKGYAGQVHDMLSQLVDLIQISALIEICVNIRYLGGDILVNRGRVASMRRTRRRWASGRGGTSGRRSTGG